MFLRRRVNSPISSNFQWDMRTALLAGAYTGAIFPFVGRIARGDLHCSPLQLSLIMAAPFMGNLFSPVWAQTMEGKSKKPFAVWSWILGRGLLLGLGAAYGSWLFVLILSLSSIIMTVSTPAYVSIMKDVYPDRLRGRMMGYIRVGLQTMALVSALVVGRLLDHYSFRYLFPAAALIGIAAALVFNRLSIPPSRFFDEPDSPKPTVKDTLSILREDRAYRHFAISIFVYGFGNLMVQPLYTLFQVDHFHITNTQVANMANLASIIAILGYFYWGRFLDRKGALRTCLVSTLLVGMINVVYLLAFRVEHLYLAAVFTGVSNAGIDLAYLNATLAFADRRKIAQYQSIHSALLGVRGIIAPFFGSLCLAVIGLHGTFGFSLGLILLGAGMQYFGLSDKHREGGWKAGMEPLRAGKVSHRQRVNVGLPDVPESRQLTPLVPNVEPQPEREEVG